MLLKDGSNATLLEESLGLLNFLSSKSEERSAHIVKVALQPMLKLLKDGSEGVKGKVAVAVAEVAFNSEQRSAQISNAGALNLLVALLKEGSSDLAKLQASYALRILASLSEERSAQVVRLGAVQLLIKLLKEGSEDAKEQASGTIGILALNSSQRSAQIVRRCRSASAAGRVTEGRI